MPPQLRCQLGFFPCLRSDVKSTWLRLRNKQSNEGSTTCTAQSAIAASRGSGGSGASRGPASSESSPNVPRLLQTGSRLKNAARTRHGTAHGRVWVERGL
ncbi:hypothetical protein AMELA_G00172580 [Ameiurus melas]|uniref:Uncharacterized protein n=1 Tax=Ameiurus melas TaxID=219545 RepID=A0A7J6ACH5_AMEME|nr:hypothetical protein AMELA_G00172580 [Ameiurus melas]